MAAVWYVEDDAGFRDIVLYTLKATGFDARGFAEGSSFFAALQGERPDLVLLDIMLPDEDGLEILRRLRAAQKTAKLPVIMATARGQEYDKVQGLDRGADDYLVKPFGMMEMISRIKAVLRRSGQEQKSVLEAGGLRVDLDSRVVTVDGERARLTLKEFELLRHFLSHPGLVFTRAQLMDGIWGEEYMGETRTVDTHILTLRQKLGKCGAFIETVRGVGYRWEADA